MYELTVKTRRDIERATLRAQAQKPRIEEVGLGMYKTWSTNPATPNQTYCTGIFPASDGNGYEVCCSCASSRFLCKHVAACFGHYLMREKQLLEVDAPAPTFAETVSEIKDICAATSTTLGAYTAEMAERDRQDLFG